MGFFDAQNLVYYQRNGFFVRNGLPQTRKGAEGKHRAKRRAKSRQIPSKKFFENLKKFLKNIQPTVFLDRLMGADKQNGLKKHP